jgi:hypothetical protein
MVWLNRRLACLPWPSVTCMVKVNVPAVVGVPDRSSPVWLSVMSELSARPGGSWPDRTDQVYGIEPPLTAAAQATSSFLIDSSLWFPRDRQ